MSLLTPKLETVSKMSSRGLPAPGSKNGKRGSNRVLSLKELKLPLFDSVSVTWTTEAECQTPARSTNPNSCSTGLALWEFFRKSAVLEGKRPWHTGEKVAKIQILFLLPSGYRGGSRPSNFVFVKTFLSPGPEGPTNSFQLFFSSFLLERPEELSGTLHRDRRQLSCETPRSSEF